VGCSDNRFDPRNSTGTRASKLDRFIQRAPRKKRATGIGGRRVTVGTPIFIRLLDTSPVETGQIAALGDRSDTFVCGGNCLRGDVRLLNVARKVLVDVDGLLIAGE
jgi:hypothetical protein